MGLRAVVIGSGWASEGHVVGLQHAGVEVLAICGRTLHQAQKLAGRLGVPKAFPDWQKAINELVPDMVAIATTAPPHREMAEAVASAGLPVACDKPLAMNASDARAMYESVAAAGVPNGYVASHSTGASARFAQSVVASGQIGAVKHVEMRSYHLAIPERPFSWWHRLADGGGELNTGFTHALEIVRRLSGGAICRAGGVPVHALDKAPLSGTFHDSRDAFRTSVDLNRRDLEFGDVDAESGFLIELELQLPDGSSASAMVAAAYGRGDGCTAVHGTDGSLLLDAEGIRIVRDDDAVEQLEIPADYHANDGTAEERVQKSWNQFFSRFVGHLEGKMGPDYPAFRDGYVACQIIDAVRGGLGFVTVDTPGAAPTSSALTRSKASTWSAEGP